MHSVTNGQLGKVNQILSYDFVDEVPAAVAMQLTQLLKQELPTTPVLHQCVTNLTRSMSTTTTSSNSTSTANTTTTTTGSNNKASSSGVATSTSDTNTSTALNTAMLTALAARRLEVAKYLLNFSRPAFELGTNNKAGLSVLHHAIINGDLKLAQLIIRTFTQQQQQQQTSTTTGIVEERRTKLNINSRCHKQGWAPIHYAVDKLDLDAVRLLIQNNANVVVTMATDKRQTPMELAKQKLKTANPANKSTIQAIIDELKLAIDRAKQNKEHLKNKNESATTTTTTTNNNDSIQSSTNKTSSTTTTTATSTTTGSNSNTTKDAKTSSEKKADNVAVAATATVSTVPVEAADTATTTTSKADKKKKKKDKTTTTTAAAVATTVAANASTKVAASAPVPTPTTTTSAPTTTTSTTTPIVPTTTKLNRKNAKKLALAQTQSTAPPEPKQTIDPIAEMSVSSRDELVDRLLAMGFLEADCLQAISLYGTDTDQAISWLCERPAVVTPTTTTTTTGNATTTPMKSSKDHKISAHSTDKKIHSTTTPSTKQSSSSTTSSSTAATSSQQMGNNAISSAQKLQREKEELRRINRAWNQKAEDEKRKVRLNYIVLFTITCCCILVYT